MIEPGITPYDTPAASAASGAAGELYREFLESKRIAVGSCGIEVSPSRVHPFLKPFQRDQVVWALEKGRCALFDDTGLGKTVMQLEWGRLMGGTGLIVAPLSVTRQTVKEAMTRLGIEVNYCRSQADVKRGINITNYEMVQHFDPSSLLWVVLDESSILKSIDGKTKALLIEMFRETPYRLCCSATPAPNDIAEIANHTEFLGHATREEMLATYFVHDDEGWRLKGWADDGPFYRWLSTWAMSVRTPSDLGYSDDGYILPPLNIKPEFVRIDIAPEGQLFFTGLKGITDRASVRKQTTDGRIERAAEIVGNSEEQWIVWCGTDAEANGINKALRGSFNVKGSMSPDEKAEKIEAFQDGVLRILVTKPKIAGAGMNFQSCHNMIFLGLSDSYEAYYQCIRRCYRFGQREPVNAYVVLSEAEQGIYQNVLRKEEEAKKMSEKLIEHVRDYEKKEIEGFGMRFEYETDTVKTDDYTLMLGDSCERMKEIPDESIHLSVFSPPFAQLYVYSPSERDIGNCRTTEEFLHHLGFIADELMRVTMPGRICAVHIADVPAMLVRDGYIGMKDLSGDVIRLFDAHGWTWDARIPIDKNQQAQSIRTHAKGLTMTQKDKDRSWLRPALPDYILKFRKPGDNPKPVNDPMTGDEWIELANPTWPNHLDRCAEWGAWMTWYGIRETDTLNVAAARDNKDERHICPLQLGTIERCIRLWSMPGETVFDPFGGIGSTGYKAIELNRKAVLCELKPSYFRTMKNNMIEVIRKRDAGTLFEAAR